jgi:UDP-N-acetylglucosamine 2-epimerase (non-hydrolysing)
MLVTLHRRENQNSAMAEIAEAIRRLGQRPDIEIVLPLHRSPAVRHVLIGHLANLPSVRLIEALDYVDFVETLAHCDIVLTDSGGIQEEAPTLLKPVIVARETTERAEAVDAGCAILAGVTQDKIFAECTRLLDDREHYTSMASGFNPFGDGKAAERIESRLRSEFESEDHNFDRAQSVLT